MTLARSLVWRTPETLWRDAMVKAPLRPRPHFNLGAAMMAKGRLDDALEEYQTAEKLSLAPGTPISEREMTQLLTGMNIADIMIRQGRYEEAHQILKQAWILNPGFPGYSVNLGWFYLHEKQPTKAVLVLSDGIVHFRDYPWFPRKGSLYINLGLALEMLGECEASREAYAVAGQYRS